VFDAEAGKDAYKFSTSFLGGKTRHGLWKEQTRPNALFFSTAIQLNNEQLKPAFDWFKLRLRVVDSVRGFSPGYTLKRCGNDEDRQRVVAFMNSADLLQISTGRNGVSADSLPHGNATAIRG
jgi:hypothetical protein